jgi:hypothetical protein
MRSVGTGHSPLAMPRTRRAVSTARPGMSHSSGSPRNASPSPKPAVSFAEGSERGLGCGVNGRAPAVDPVTGLPPPAGSGQVFPRRPKNSTYRCFLPDLTGFAAPRRVGPSLQRHQSLGSPCSPRPRAGIRPRYSGLRVQGTASSPSSTTVSMLSRRRPRRSTRVSRGSANPKRHDEGANSSSKGRRPVDPGTTGLVVSNLLHSHRLFRCVR